LLAVAGSKVTADAAAGSSAAAAAAGALYHSEYGDVSAELEPQLCLLLHRSEVYEEELTNTLDYFKAQHPVSAQGLLHRLCCCVDVCFAVLLLCSFLCG
jgi:hypothetical protein